MRENDVRKLFEPFALDEEKRRSCGHRYQTGGNRQKQRTGALLCQSSVDCGDGIVL